MKTKIVKEKFHQLIPSEREKTIYVAEDEKEFSDEKSCIKHEENLKNIKAAEGLIDEIWSSDYDDIICKLVFDGYDNSSSKFFKCKSTQNIQDIEKIMDYLRAKNYRCTLRETDFTWFDENEIILICKWIEGEDSDYSSFQMKAKSLKEATEIIDNFFNEIKSKL